LLGRDGQGLTNDWRAYGLKKVIFAIEDLNGDGFKLTDRKRWKTFISRFEGHPAVEVDHGNSVFFRSLLTASTRAMEVDTS